MVGEVMVALVEASTRRRPGKHMSSKSPQPTNKMLPRMLDQRLQSSEHNGRGTSQTQRHSESGWSTCLESQPVQLYYTDNEIIAQAVAAMAAVAASQKEQIEYMMKKMTSGQVDIQKQIREVLSGYERRTKKAANIQRIRLDCNAV